MRMDASYRIENLCDHDDGGRSVLEYVNITTWQGNPVAVAADGYCLAIVPVEMEPNDLPGLVHWTVFEGARDERDRDIVLMLGADTIGMIDGWTAPRLMHSEPLVFPDVVKVIPDLTNMPEAWPAFAVNPQLMVKIAEAIGSRFVVCHRGGPPNDIAPLLAPRFWDGVPEPPFGVCMPAKFGGIPDEEFWHERSQTQSVGAA